LPSAGAIAIRGPSGITSPYRINAPFLEAEKIPLSAKLPPYYPFVLLQKRFVVSFFTLQNTTNTMPTAPGQLAKFLLQIETSVLAFDVAMK
jgi:hypothetical protein